MYASRAVALRARVAVPRLSIAATRGFAEASKPPSASPQNVQPPVEVFGVDGIYASSLYTAAAKNSALDTVARALNTLNDNFKKDTKLQSILTTPTLTTDDKKQIVNELQKNTGVSDKASTLHNFLHTLAENNRLNVLEGVCEKFAVLMSAARGEVELRITSAAPLDNKVVQQLEKAIGKSQYVGQGKKLKVVPKVNPDIRGGLIVEIGDRTIDLSVSNRMARMNKLLNDTL